MLDEVWKFFLKIEESDKDEVNDSEVLTEDQWDWLIQTKKLEATDFWRNSIVSSSISEVILRFAMRSEIYKLTICRSPRRISGKFSEGFNHRNITNLKSLVEEYTRYLEVLDEAIHEIRDVQYHGFSVNDIRFDEDENDLLAVDLTEEKSKEKLKILVNYANIREFPRSLHSSRSANFECERWNNDDRLGTNLLRLFQEDKEEEKCIEEDQEELDKGNDFMDFI